MSSPLIPLRLASWDDSVFEALTATSINGVVAFDERGLIRGVNDACESLFQYQRADIMGRGLHVLLASPFREEYETRLRNFQDTGEITASRSSREIMARRKDGSAFPIFLSVGESVQRGKRVFFAVIQDVTDLRLERAIHNEERAFLAAIVDSSNDAIVSKTLDGKITSWNRAAEKLFGYNADEMIGTPITQLFPSDRIHEEAEILQKIRNGVSVEHYETVRQKKDGTAIDVSVTISPICDAKGRVIGASKTVRDITEDKKNEARLRALSDDLNHVARLNEMGQLSAALAHELNQPLAALLNYTNLAKRLISMGADSEKSIAAVTKASEQAVRAGQIIRRLRNFVEKRDSTQTKEDINAVVEDAIALGLMGVKASDVVLDLQLDHTLSPVMMDRVQIQQVLVNLIRNGVEAMEHARPGQLTITTVRGDGNSIVVGVGDTGTGIAESIADQLFQPFVTTKAGGMGIGLAISRSLIESHGGRLSVTPNEGGGTAFHFTLPT